MITGRILRQLHVYSFNQTQLSPSTSLEPSRMQVYNRTILTAEDIPEASQMRAALHLWRKSYFLLVSKEVENIFLNLCPILSFRE